MSNYILSLDQGTTSSRAVLFNKKGELVSLAQKEIKQIYPKNGWVEHNPREIWASQSGVMREVIESAGIDIKEVKAIGITNQRETTIVWNKKTGKPIYNAIVWQCRRTANICEDLKTDGLQEYIKDTTGLVIDAYFSATKIKWILDNVEGARELAENGKLAFGTVDSWLIWNLTRGKLHITDYSNASRTMLYDINNLCWDNKLLKRLNIPIEMMPEVRNSSEIYGYLDEDLFGKRVPIAGIAGDQQAALFGQTCFKPGMVKNTYGTGCFILMQTGEKKITSNNGLLTTIAWGIDDKVYYALEGSVFIGGAVIQWLRDELMIIDNAEETEELALKVKDNNGVYIVPAFSGLGAPHWDMYARGTIVGLTRGANRNHIVRAALESIAYQSKDVIDAMVEDSELPLRELRVDGGASRNKFLMQFQADILNSSVLKPKVTETTALGAAYLAGLATGFWSNEEEIIKNWYVKDEYVGSMSINEISNRYHLWLKAVEKSKKWVE
ncbi:MAG: glycerol kinase GlpK [Clostridia bacterium]